MKTYTAIPYKPTGEILDAILTPMHRERVTRLGFTYLHGDLEKMAGYDVFGFVGDVPTEEGIYNVLTLLLDKEVNCTLFLWKSNEIKGLQGLCVANDDIESLNDAQEKFNTKSYFI